MADELKKQRELVESLVRRRDAERATWTDLQREIPQKRSQIDQVLLESFKAGRKLDQEIADLERDLRLHNILHNALCGQVSAEGAKLLSMQIASEKPEHDKLRDRIESLKPRTRVAKHGESPQKIAGELAEAQAEMQQRFGLSATADPAGWLRRIVGSNSRI